MKPIRIESREIAPGRPTFVIAEIGVNHDGSVDHALELVQHAAAAGADAVKLQIFRADALMHGSADFATYQKDRCADAAPADMLRRYELDADAIARIVANIREKGLIPLATPFSPDDLPLIDRLNLPAIKIASPDIVNRILLKCAAALGKPLLISTGAATLEEVSESVSWLNTLDAPLALLHCVSSYPTPPADANLSWITQLARHFDIPIGHSDHTTEELTGALAVAAGAMIVEKHLTYDRTAPGPDHAASADPAQFARYVRTIRLAEQMRGTGEKRVLDIEQDVRRVSRQSLVAVRDLSAGHILSEDDLTAQRPGTGIPAAQIAAVIGRRLTRSTPHGTMLQWPMLAAL